MSGFSQWGIVANGSFENGFDGWTANGVSLHVNEPGSAQDGSQFSEMNGGGNIWQDLTTTPGRVYVLRYYMGGGPLRVSFGGSAVDTNNLSNPWTLRTYLVTATSNVTRLQFDNLNSTSADLDSVAVVPSSPAITYPVISRSAFEGATVVFSVGADGAAPLQYQWFSKNGALTAVTNVPSLVLNNLKQSDAGSYWVVVTNSYGSVTSRQAILAVNPLPQVPVITSQPKDLNVVAGYSTGFFVTAVAADPLSYQWMLNETNVVSGATTNRLIFNPVNVTNAGKYSVVVSNQHGTVTSFPAVLSVTNGGPGGGYINFANAALGVNAPIYDVDGVTPLAGSAFAAQLYTGTSSNELHAVSAPVAFSTGGTAGYYVGAAPVPDVPVGGYTYAQVRVWETAKGQSYEQAQINGGKFGASAIFYVVTGNPPPAVPANLVGLHSFSLQAGSDLYAAAKIEYEGKLPDGSRQWSVIGESNAVYNVERRTLPEDWVPFLTVTNVTGIVTFTDPDAQNSSVRFYRAQIVNP